MYSAGDVVALERRWQRFDVEYRLPSDLPASVKACDGKIGYSASASVSIVRSLSRVAPAAWSTSVQCWSPDVRFSVQGTFVLSPLQSVSHLSPAPVKRVALALVPSSTSVGV